MLKYRIFDLIVATCIGVSLTVVTINAKTRTVLLNTPKSEEVIKPTGFVPTLPLVSDFMVVEKSEVEKEESSQRTESFYPFTDYELDLLARLVQSETGGSSLHTKEMVASVVLNRAIGNGMTIEEVIYSPNQFSVTFTYYPDGTLMIDRPLDQVPEQEAYDSVLASVSVLLNGPTIPSDVTVFFEYGCTEPWVSSRRLYEVSDTTAFAYYYE